MRILSRGQSLTHALLILLALALPLHPAAAETTTSTAATTTTTRPNIVYIMSDDHAAHAISAYGSKINKTPNIDRIASEGILLENCFATNALCAPSRASILTGKYSHLNGVLTHRSPPFDGTQVTYPKLLQEAGYQTAVIGKWHLKSDPTGFDYWNILIGQGLYHNPRFIDNGTTRTIKGYATDIIADLSIDYLEKRDKDRPFLLVCQHKAPHRPWQPDEKHAHMYENEDIPVPDNFFDDYTSRTYPAAEARLRVADHMDKTDVKADPPAELTGKERALWYYQRYIKDYLRCVASVDDNVGRLMDYLEKEKLLDNTIFIYTSDQGFFLGDHGWYDKRFMYEESLRMPFVARYPKEIKAGSKSDAFVANIDFASTLLDYAGIKAPAEMQGTSFRKTLAGTDEKRPDVFYYHFHEFPDADHYAPRHYGVRTGRYKLIRFYHPKESWELFDLQKDPKEMQSVYDDPAYADTVTELKALLEKQRLKYKDDIAPPVK